LTKLTNVVECIYLVSTLVVVNIIQTTQVYFAWVFCVLGA